MLARACVPRRLAPLGPLGEICPVKVPGEAPEITYCIFGQQPHALGRVVNMRYFPDRETFTNTAFANYHIFPVVTSLAKTEVIWPTMTTDVR